MKSQFNQEECHKKRGEKKTSAYKNEETGHEPLLI